MYDLEGNVVGEETWTNGSCLPTLEDLEKEQEQLRADLKDGGWTDEEIDDLIADYKEENGW